MKNVALRLLNLTAIVVTAAVMLACNKNTPQVAPVNIAEIEQFKPAKKWFVERKIDKFTNVDLSRASIVSDDVSTSKKFESTFLKLTVNREPNKKDGFGFFAFGENYTRALMNYVELMPQCFPKCDVLVRFDDGVTEKFTFNAPSRIHKIEGKDYIEFNNKLIISNENKNGKDFLNKFVNSTKVDVRFPFDTHGPIDFTFNIESKLDWNSD